ncbi:Hemicentin-1 [Manis pentadactyla]|nr:Hemicentin-1 [Manis pentadactyla]
MRIMSNHFIHREKNFGARSQIEYFKQTVFDEDQGRGRVIQPQPSGKSCLMDQPLYLICFHQDKSIKASFPDLSVQ